MRTRGTAMGAEESRNLVPHSPSSFILLAIWTNESKKSCIQRAESVKNDKLGTDSGSLPPLALGWPCPVIGLAVRKNAAAEGRRGNTRRGRSRECTRGTLAICSTLHSERKTPGHYSGFCVFAG